MKHRGMGIRIDLLDSSRFQGHYNVYCFLGMWWIFNNVSEERAAATFMAEEVP
jgi:hypothetical protein